MQKISKNHEQSFWSIDTIRTISLDGNRSQQIFNSYDSRTHNSNDLLIVELKNYLRNNPYLRKIQCNAFGKFFLNHTFNMHLSKVKAQIAYLAIQDLQQNLDIKVVKQRVLWATEYYRKQYTELVLTKGATIKIITDVGKLEKIFGIKNRLPYYDYCDQENLVTKDNPYFCSIPMAIELHDVAQLKD
jgi:hypothetical protein